MLYLWNLQKLFNFPVSILVVILLFEILEAELFHVKLGT